MNQSEHPKSKEIHEAGLGERVFEAVVWCGDDTRGMRVGHKVLGDDSAVIHSMRPRGEEMKERQQGSPLSSHSCSHTAHSLANQPSQQAAISPV